MFNNKILFIVEGENDEVSFVRKLLDKCNPSFEYDIYSYRCNIHVLAQIIYNEYPDFETDEIDIQLVLKSKETNKRKREILSQSYRDIFLIFDFEPQHNLTHFDTVLRMLNYFSDSSNHGKLYINYPMMQSYKHFALLPDDSFMNRKVTMDECKSYKKIVGDMSGFTDINTYSYITFISLIVHHLRKANYLITGKYVIPSCEEYLSWNGAEVFDCQCNFLETKRYIYVLNTSIFLNVDFRPCEFFRTILKRSDEFHV